MAIKAESNTFWKWLLNRVLWKKVPFNKPHGFWVETLTSEEVIIKIPHKKVNHNHLGGIHACAMATASEYASGLLLLHALDMKMYRLIMQSISIEYHYQGKIEALTRFSFSRDSMEEKVIGPLKKQEKVFLPCVVETYDKQQNKLCTATVNWQLKKWSAVKTKP